MKKVLLASTALVVSTGFAFADAHTGMSLSGGAVAGFQYDADADDEFVLHTEIDFNVVGSGESDNGLTFGASLDLDLDDTETTAEHSDLEIFVSGAFGTLTIGGVDQAPDPMGFSDVGFDGIGVDDNAEAFRAIGSANLHYSYESGPLTFGVSGSVADGDDSATGDYGVLVGYMAGGIDVQLGLAHDSEGNATLGADATAVSVGVKGSAGDISYSVFFHSADGDALEAQGYGGSLSFANGPMTYTVAAGATDVDGDDADFGVGFKYDLGGGLAVAGGVGSVGNLGEARTVADLGLTMDF
ncbi:MAG: porin [Paracoccaceae bacterium]|nr:porin [Paracoccaceae bacterium]